MLATLGKPARRCRHALVLSRDCKKSLSRGTAGFPQATGPSDAPALASRDNRGMEEPRARGQVVLGAALGAVLGLASVAELTARLVAGSTVTAAVRTGSTVHTGLASGATTHTGVSVTTALLMCAFCLLATVPVVLPRPVLAAATVCLAAVLSLVLFELVTVAGAAALLFVAYRLARAGTGGGARVLAVALAVPFLGIAVALAAAPRPTPVVGTVSGLAGAGGDTSVLTVLLASAIPVVALAGMARRAREDSRTVVAVRELTEGVLAEHLARGERARIARELHDVVAHHISMIAVQAETARLTTPGLTETGAQRFAAIGDTARAGLTEMRRLLGVLREDAAERYPQPPDGAEATGWPAARRPQPGLPQLGELVDEARDASGTAARLIVSGPVTRLDPGVELAAYRIVQEALTNVRRHAPGAAVDVELRYADDALRLRVRDNGPGPGAEPAGPRYSPGHGLLGMRERAAAAGGSVSTGEGPGGGFCVEAELPAKTPDTMTGTGTGS
jgi:signal transduction histidine kinase